jgi:hypothetical protein
VPGEVNRVRLFDGRIWIVTDEGITAYALTGGRLGLRARLEIPHARDVAGLERNYVAVAGTFGRGIVRLHDDEHGPGGTFVHLHRQPGHLSRASCDGYYLLAECDDGCWQYEIGVGPPLPAELPAAEGIRPEAWEPATAATTVWGSAAISEDRLSVRIRTARGEARYADPNGCRLHCLAAVAGNIWIGHDGGITVLEISPGGGIHGGSAEGAVIVGGRMRLPGVVRYLFPLGKGEGAAFVCDSGLMGAAAFVLP